MELTFPIPLKPLCVHSHRPCRLFSSLGIHPNANCPFLQSKPSAFRFCHSPLQNSKHCHLSPALISSLSVL